MSIDNIFTVACEKVIIDSSSRMPSAINCLLGGDVGDFPTQLPGFSILSLWNSDRKGEAEIRYMLRSPSGKDIELGKTTAPLDSGLILKAHLSRGFMAEEAGTYSAYVKISFEGESWKGMLYPIHITCTKSNKSESK